VKRFRRVLLMKKIKMCAAILAAVMMVTVFTGCSKKNVTNLTADQVSFADPMAEKVLTAINEGDYSKFSGDFDDTMKKKLDEAAFKQTRDLLKTKIGDYQSKTFTAAQADSKYTVVVYNVKYTNEPDGAKITISFSQKDGKYLVSGFFINSPKLSK
jgi:hypothetical protein